MGRSLLYLYVFVVPVGIAESAVKFTVLTGKILVVQVQPVVFRQVAADNFLIIQHIVRYFGILENQRNGIIPWQLIFWRINRNFRCLFQLYYIHINRWVAYFGNDL